MQKIKKQNTPLAERLRPKTLKSFVGQKHLLDKNGVLKKLIEKDELSSIIFWGPPGSGKTTLARIIARRTRSRFIPFSAVTAGIKEVREVVTSAKKINDFSGQQTILFIDEIHRFNKAQQDVFLPHIENGTINLMGATTENPSFSVISPLLSRCQVIKLLPLSEKEILQILKRAARFLHLSILKNAAHYIARTSGGDARIAINIAEAAAKIQPRINLKINLKLAQSVAEKTLLYDKGGDEHYDTISAFIKSLRGSDPDAALHYLARMIKAGEDPRFIARRMVILASEDIGNADPHSLMVASATAQAVEYVGMPEAAINLAQCVCYLASAPKSNASYRAYLSAMTDLKRIKLPPIPLKLRNAVTDLMKELNYGQGYQYAHNFKNHLASDREYLPKELKGKKYYQPTSQGFEKEIKRRLNEHKLNKE